MRVSVVNLQTTNLKTANLKQNFKSRENKNNNNSRKQRSINSLDPKALALAAALVTMTPACTRQSHTPQQQPVDTVSEYVTKNYREYDSLQDTKRFYFAQLHELLDTDKAKFEQTGRNTFKGDIDFNNHKVRLNITSTNDDLTAIEGVLTVAGKWDNGDNIYVFEAQILDRYNTNIKLKNVVNQTKAPDEYLLHRNFDGQLFAIDKKTNNVTVLNKSFLEQLNEKEKALEEKQSDKDVMYSIMALAAFTLFAGYISGLKAGQTRKINNKNANTQN